MAKSILYEDIRSINDSVAPGQLKDNEALILTNVKVGLRGGVETRGGTEKLNKTSTGAEIERMIEWNVSGQSRKLFSVGTTLHLLNADGTSTKKLQMTSDQFRAVTIQNALYIADGTELYSWGRYDYGTAMGVQTVKTGEVVMNTPASSGGGVLGHFYQAMTDRTSVNLSSVNFTDGNWLDVTDVVGVISNVIKPVMAKDAAAYEEEKLVINYNASVAGYVVVTLGGISTNVSIAAGDTATAVAGKIRSTAFAGWTTSGSGAEVYFKATTSGVKTTPQYDAGATGAYGVMSVKTTGKTDDNNLSDVKKCRMFLQHPLSKRIFATGNPDNPTAVYYSDYNDMTYWPKTGILYPTTSESKAIAMQLLSESLMVGFDNTWWYWTGIDPAADATWKMLNIPYGPLNADCVVMTPFSFTFASKTGIYKVASSILNETVVMLQNQQMIEPLTQEKAEVLFKSIANPDYCRMVFHDNRILLAYSTKAGRNTMVLEYNMDTDGFSVYEGWAVNWWCRTSGGDLLFTSTNYILKTDTGTSDIDVMTGEKKAIEIKIETKDWDLGDGLAAKFPLFMYLLFRPFKVSAKPKVDVTLITDYATREYKEINLTNGFRWGAPWGGKWGVSNTALLELRGSPGIVARTFRLRITNKNIDDPVGFYGAGFEFKQLRPRAKSMD